MELLEHWIRRHIGDGETKSHTVQCCTAPNIETYTS